MTDNCVFALYFIYANSDGSKQDDDSVTNKYKNEYR